MFSIRPGRVVVEGDSPPFLCVCLFILFLFGERVESRSSRGREEPPKAFFFCDNSNNNNTCSSCAKSSSSSISASSQSLSGAQCAGRRNLWKLSISAATTAPTTRGRPFRRRNVSDCSIRGCFIPTRLCPPSVRKIAENIIIFCIWVIPSRQQPLQQLLYLYSNCLGSNYHSSSSSMKKICLRPTLAAVAVVVLPTSTPLMGRQE